MASAEPFWSLRRLTDAFGTPSQRRSSSLYHSSARPPRTCIVTEQHIETIGGTDKPQRFFGNPRLPIELVISIALLAARDAIVNGDQAEHFSLINRACHKAILCQLQLPRLCLSGAAQMRAFLRSLELNTDGFRSLASSRVQTLAFRRHETKIQGSQRPSLFDASSAQLAFERECMPLVRSILSCLVAVERLTIEGVPRSLVAMPRHKLTFDRVFARITSLDCLTGHYAGGIDPTFWDPSSSRWARLTHLQLHGPQFRFNTAIAQALGQLPSLTHLALVVPAIVRTDAQDFARQELSLIDRQSPLQTLVDCCTHLQVLLVVAHTDKRFVGYVERLRFYLRAVHQNVAPGSQRLRIQLVTLMPASAPEPADRMHPLEVSTWMMDRAQLCLQWSFDPEIDYGTRDEPSELRYYTEAWDAPELPQRDDCRAGMPAVRQHWRDASDHPAIDQALDGVIDTSDDST